MPRKTLITTGGDIPLPSSDKNMLYAMLSLILLTFVLIPIMYVKIGDNKGWTLYFIGFSALWLIIVVLYVIFHRRQT